jgi:hypothetical protein
MVRNRRAVFTNFLIDQPVRASILWGSITGLGLDRLPGWDHRLVVISVVYLLVRCLLGCMRVLSRG